MLLASLYADIRAVVAIVPSGVVFGGLGPSEPGDLRPREAWTLEGKPVPLERATIPVERIKAPVLMVSGRDDQLWPSFELAEIARRRLEGHNHPWPFEHISHPDAGRAMAPPYAPTTATTIVHPVTHQTLALGGTSKGQIEANVAYWRRTLDFLAEAEARSR